MIGSSGDNALAGWTILLAEDEYLVALEVVRILEVAGATVVGPVAKVAQALALVAGGVQIDGAVLDINLAGDPIYPVAEALNLRAIPMVFATGYDASAILPAFAATTRCEKPLEAHRLVAALKAARKALRDKARLTRLPAG